MDVLRLAKVDEFGGRVIRVELDLVDGWQGLAGMLGEEVVEVLDAKVRDSDVSNLVFRELLHLFPIR